MGVTVKKLRSSGDYRCQYPGQYHVQPAHLELTEDGIARVTYNPEIGNAVPMAVWHGREKRWSVPAAMKLRDMRKLLKDATPYLNRVYVGMGERWDGNNMVGTMTEDALEAHHEITNLIDEAEGELLIEDWKGR